MYSEHQKDIFYKLNYIPASSFPILDHSGTQQETSEYRSIDTADTDMCSDEKFTSFL